jgi:AraC-like DNA-binding protein
MSELAEICARHCRGDGEFGEALEGLTLFRRSQPREELCGVQRPALGVVAQGSKTVIFGAQALSYGPAQYLLISVDMPVVSYPVDASPDRPYLGLALELEPCLIWDVMVAASDIRHGTRGALPPGLQVSTMEKGLEDAVLRLARLLEQPDDQAVLFPMLKREIIFRLLRGSQSAALQRLATGDGGGCVLEAIRILRERYDQVVKMESLASDLGVSLSSLHHQFKAVTTMSPLQYQKQLRLQEARRRLLGQQGDAASVAFAVGYNSPSQFSREYKRLFGEPPSRDVERLRSSGS